MHANYHTIVNLALIIRAHEPRNRLFSRQLFSSNSVPRVIRKGSVQPQLSASLVVVNQRNEILLVQRNPNASAYGGMHVFPGGKFDKTQDESLEMTAIRETFEESGLLLASTPDPSAPFLSDSILDEARHAIHEQRMDFGKFLQTHSLRPDMNLLLPFTQWVTPVGPPRRFQTQFYVTFLPAASSSSFSGLRSLTHDDRREVISARFLHPNVVLEECRSGNIRCLPPQFYILSIFAEILSGPISTMEQRQKTERLSADVFGKMTLIPRNLGKDEDRRVILALKGDEMYGGQTGRRHRILGEIVEGGAIVASCLIRNFDILNEIEGEGWHIPGVAKL